MASKYDGKTTAIETHDNSLGESYRKSDGNEETDTSGVEINGAGVGDDVLNSEILGQALETLEKKKTAWYAYLTTADFWFVLALGQILALCITGTNTFTSLLAQNNFGIPAFQNLLNYICLCVIFSSYTVYRYGFKRYGKILLVDGWKYFLLSFMDVLGNYFTVLAYQYTNLLSAQLLNFWSIICVVIVSFLLLKVRYKWVQILGILLCCGGMGILLTSDHITGANGGSPPTMLKGDLFGLAGATFYGLSNVMEEWFVSKRPAYEVLGMLGLFGILIDGTITGIFNHSQLSVAVWSNAIGGYLAGYTLCLLIFYSLAPLILRMASAAFFDISLLTGNFWGVIIGIKVFGYSIYYLYPIAFVLIIIGLVVYFLAGSMLGDSKKPWLGAGQEDGVAGFGTAKLKAINEARREGLMRGGDLA